MNSLIIKILFCGLVVSLTAKAQILIVPTGGQTSEQSEYEKELAEQTVDNNKPVSTESKKKSNNLKKTTKPVDYKNWDDEGSKMWNGPRTSLKDSLLIGVDVRHYKYNEPGVVTHQGLMYGVWGQYTAAFNAGDLVFNSHVLYGQLTYDGALCDSLNNCTDTQTDQTDLIHKSKASWNFNPFNKNSDFNFKIGLGYRYLSDRYDAAGFYTRIGLWGFIPVGVAYKNKINSDWQMHLDFEYQQVVYGSIKSFLSEINSGNEDLELSQTGYGLEAQFGMTYQQDYFLGAYVDAWYLNESERATVQLVGFPERELIEPANNSISFGLRAAYDFF